MYVSTHFATGAVMGKLAGGNVLGFFLGLFSHILLDLIPHHDYKKPLGAILDGFFALLMSFFFFKNYPANVLWGALGAALPDLEILWNYLRCKGSGRLFFPTHSGLLPHGKLRFPAGFLLQTFLVAGFLLFLQKMGSPIIG